MRINSEWIHYADEALHSVGIVILYNPSQDKSGNKDQSVSHEEFVFPKEFNGYISSFAATIVQTGIYPALLIYENKESKSASKRYLVPLAVWYILNKLSQEEKISLSVNNRQVLSLQYQQLNREQRKELKQNIEKAIIALKITIRMYKPLKDLKLRDKNTIKLEEGSPDNSINKNDESFYSQSNIGWLYYRDYYHGYSLNKTVQEDVFKTQKNKRLLNSTLGNALSINNKIIESLRTNQFDSIKFKTTNPGLIIGLGLSHGTKVENDYKCGFQFDYTSGLPYIPGSAVKGMLRSLFPSTKVEDKGSTYNVNRKDYIISALDLGDSITEEDIVLLTRRIFDPDGTESSSDFLFMDALISDGPKDKGGKQLPFMSNDFITPHNGPLTAPIPIEFLKVLPNVEFTFFFKVVPISFKGKIITTSEILNLYKQILLDTGIGAKTNVGYGQLQHDEPDEDKASSPTMT